MTHLIIVNINEYLLTLNIDNNYLFALSSRDYLNVDIDIDMSKISIYDGDELILQPIDDINSFIKNFHIRKHNKTSFLKKKNYLHSFL